MYSQKFNDALASQTMIRKIWKNQNSNKDQYTVQFMQELERGAEETDPTQLIVAMSQGIENTSQRVTALQSVAGDVLRKAGISLDDKEYFSGDNILPASKLFGVELEIQVVENTTRNPYSNSQEPKINPSTKEVIKDGEGNPIYRHTSIVPYGAAKHVFLQGTTIPQPENKNNLAELAQSVEG